MKEAITGNMKKGFLVFLVEEGNYPGSVLEIVASAQKMYNSICYVCLSSTRDDVLAWMNPSGIDVSRFYFIDTMSAYYGKRQHTKSCFFASSPSSLDQIKEALSEAIKKRGCGIVIFDAISSLLQYKDAFSVLKFTHSLMTENSYTEAKKLYIVMMGDSLPEEESKKLVTDLQMFADSVIEI